MFPRKVSLISGCFLLLVVSSAYQAFGQQTRGRRVNRIPVYRSAQDSVKLFEIQKQIEELKEHKRVDVKRLDSLVVLYEKQYEVAIKTFRNLYFPSPDHLSLDSLSEIGDLSTVRKVSIHNLQEKDLPAIIFECRNLESLELVNTGIRWLSEELNALRHLKSVRIYNARTTRRIRLGKNNHITTLVIRGDDPQVLPRSYRRFAALEVLDLSGNNLTRFPNGSRRNAALRELILRNNRIKLEGKLKKHPQLETLALQHNEISRVRRKIRNFPSLRKLNFNYNKIKEVHPHIGHLTQLEHLSFYRNQLSSIPAGIYTLENLREIDLFYNRIETIEGRIKNWQHLRMLYLSHNRLSALPPEIGRLTSLEGLYVWDNHLETLPPEIAQLKNLRFLWVNNNSLRELPSALLSLHNLEELDVSHNFLTRVAPDIFAFSRVKILSLVENPWSEESRNLILREGSKLRAREVSVHLPD